MTTAKQSSRWTRWHNRRAHSIAQLHAWLPRALLAQVNDEARARGISRAAFVQDALRREVEAVSRRSQLAEASAPEAPQ